MSVPITTPQVLSRLGSFKDDLRPFTVMSVPFPKRETVRDPLWTGYFILPGKEPAFIFQKSHKRMLDDSLTKSQIAFEMNGMRSCFYHYYEMWRRVLTEF